jgi:hypothetical protein
MRYRVAVVLRLVPALALLGVALSPGVGRAQSAEELAFWQAVTQSNRPAEYQAYLDTYPNGRFAALARLRVQQGAAPVRSLATAAPAIGPVPAAEPVSQAWVRPIHAHVRLVDGITLDLDAQALRNSSNLRVAVVPAGTPDAIAAPQGFVEDSTPVQPSRMRLTIPGGPAGHDEVRLYHIPRFADTYAVAARAAIEVAPGVAGATLVRDLVRESVHIGPVRFEANHRDRPLLVQAAFLRVRPRTDWHTEWFGGRPVDEIPRQIVIVSIGQPGVTPDINGSLGEGICVLPVGDQAMLDRLAAMQMGDPILVTGIPTSWGGAGPTDPVLLDRCVLHP